MSLDELARLEFDVQEAIWHAYEQADASLKELGWIKPPEGPRLTIEQFKARIEGHTMAAQQFSMRTVVTGARRKWKRNR